MASNSFSSISNLVRVWIYVFGLPFFVSAFALPPSIGEETIFAFTPTALTRGILRIIHWAKIATYFSVSAWDASF